MDLDLKEGWEKKALIGIVVIVIIIVLYAFNPLQPKTNITTYNETPTPNTTNPAPFQQTVVTDSNNNSTNNTGNITTQISADQAKSIAEQAFPGYKAGDPTQGTVVINSTTIAVWIVPLKSSTLSSKTVYVDITTGRIIKES